MRTTTTGRDPATSLQHLGSGVSTQIDCRLSTYAEDEPTEEMSDASADVMINCLICPA